MKTKTAKSKTVTPKDVTSTRKVIAFAAGGISAALVYATAMEMIVTAMQLMFSYGAFIGFFSYFILILLLVWMCVSAYSKVSDYVLSGRVDHDIKRVRGWIDRVTGGLRHA